MHGPQIIALLLMGCSKAWLVINVIKPAFVCFVWCDLQASRLYAAEVISTCFQFSKLTWPNTANKLHSIEEQLHELAVATAGGCKGFH